MKNPSLDIARDLDVRLLWSRLIVVLEARFKLEIQVSEDSAVHVRNNSLTLTVCHSSVHQWLIPL
jgi:hypothetical protein